VTRLAFEGGWSLDLPDEFQRTKREGGLDATDGARTVRLSSLSLKPKRPDVAPPSAIDLHAKRKPAQTAHELTGPLDWGWAEISEDADGPHLKGTREADGTVLTCWISYPDPHDREWALGVWRAAHWERSEA
jgi:hypothetical protein